MEPQKSIVLPVALAVLISAVVFGAGGYYLANNQNTNDTTTVTPTNTTQTTTTAKPSTIPTIASTTTTSATDETASWKSYANTKYSYNVKYPTNWEYKVVTDEQVEFREVGKTYEVEASDIYAIGIFVAANKDNKTAKQLAQARKDNITSYGFTATTKDITVAGLPATQVIDYLGTHTFLVKGSQSFTLVTPNLGDETQNKTISAIYEKMLTTLSFTK